PQRIEAEAREQFQVGDAVLVATEEVLVVPGVSDPVDCAFVATPELQGARCGGRGGVVLHGLHARSKATNGRVGLDGRLYPPMARPRGRKFGVPPPPP